jgi:hypothetical protein
MNSTNSIDIFRDYPDNKFNLLVPVKTITQISPLHKVSINTVEVSKDLKDGDIYLQDKGKNLFALTKKGLMKFMATANIQVVKSESVTPSSCKRCMEMAKVTRTPAPCSTCRSKDDVAWAVTIAVPDLSGGYRLITANKEFLCETEQEQMKNNTYQYKQAFAFRSAHAESKALLRALREALMIKPTYELSELSKPFAVPVISPNFDDKDLKNAAVQRFANGSSSLYGGGLSEPLQLAECAAECADFEDGDAVEVEVVDTCPEPAFDDFVECQGCGEILEPFKDSSGNEWSVKRTKEYSNAHFGKTLCKKCIAVAVAEKKKGAA